VKKLLRKLSKLLDGPIVSELDIISHPSKLMLKKHKRPKNILKHTSLKRLDQEVVEVTEEDSQELQITKAVDKICMSPQIQM